MIDSSLQKAIFTALSGLVLGRIYDQVPASPQFPYITIGDEQDIEDGNSCEDGWEVFTDVHVWSRPDAGSKAALKDLMAQIVPLLAINLNVTGFRVVTAKLVNSRAFRDPDGQTEHGVLTFRYLIDPA